MRSAFRVALCLVVLCTGACAAEAPVNDAAYDRDPPEAIGRLLDAGKATRGADLRAQLGRKRAGLTLPRPATAKMLPEAVYALRAKSVVVVTAIWHSDDARHWHNSRATGFAIASGGIVVTNYHVVEDAEIEALGVTTRDGQTFAVREILAADKVADVAVLRTDARSLPPIPLAPEVATGAAVTCISHPDGRFFTLSSGIVSRRFASNRLLRISVTADYAKGSSGGPILDASGNAVGMVASTNSIYYSMRRGAPVDLQMVEKICVPAEAILAAAGKA